MWDGETLPLRSNEPTTPLWRSDYAAGAVWSGQNLRAILGSHQLAAVREGTNSEALATKAFPPWYTQVIHRGER